MEEFYVAMSNAIKARDHAKGRVTWWLDKVQQAEQQIETLVATQHVELADTTPSEGE